MHINNVMFLYISTLVVMFFTKIDFTFWHFHLKKGRFSQQEKPKPDAPLAWETPGVVYANVCVILRKIPLGFPFFCIKNLRILRLAVAGQLPAFGQRFAVVP